MAVHLHDLAAAVQLGSPEANPEVHGIAHDSRQVRPGDIYAAIVGERFDGRDYVAQVAQKGAAAVIGRGPVPENAPLPWVEVDDPRPLLGALASRIYGMPQERLTVVGITGTNGKTSIVHLAASMLEAAGKPCGRGGTLGYFLGDQAYSVSGRTTPEAPELFRTLKEMADAGAEAVALEVSSHGLALGRVSTLNFDVAAFTNLTRDHLDFHGTMEEYFEAKRLLFDQLKPNGRAVVALDDDYGRRLAADLREKLGDRLLTCGEEETADVSIAEAGLDFQGLRLKLQTPRGLLEVRSRLIGRYNVWNTLITAAIGEALGLPHDVIARGIEETETVDGRLDAVQQGQKFPVYIDYAHTPGALEATLRSLRELSERKLAVVFGCGGNRDQGKRPEMGRIVGELAELPLATSDNPRDEDPQQILDEVAAGLADSGQNGYRLILDRRDAIREAVRVATAAPDDWIVVVAGKGHEEMQIIGNEELPFSDRDELKAALAEEGYRHG